MCKKTLQKYIISVSPRRCIVERTKKNPLGALSLEKKKKPSSFVLIKWHRVSKRFRFEAGWNISAVALRTVERDEKGTRCLGV
jgi:hypothetical protein